MMNRCAHVACDAPVYSRGVCRAHHTALLWPPTTCAVHGCESPTRARGWCEAHYTRWRRHGHPGGAPLLRKRASRYPCVPDLSLVRDEARALRERDPQAARRLVAEALERSVA